MRGTHRPNNHGKTTFGTNTAASPRLKPKNAVRALSSEQLSVDSQRFLHHAVHCK